MDIYLDDERVEYAPQADDSLEVGLRKLQATLVAPERILVSLKCDGVLLVDDDLREALQRPLSAHRCIEILTSTPGEIAAQALTDARAALKETEDRRARVADQLSSGRTTEGMQGLSEMLAVWQQVHDVVTKSLALLGLDPGAIRIEEITLEAALDTPRQQLVQVRDALADQDYVRLADVLEYEFPQAAAVWDRLIAVLLPYAGVSKIILPRSS